jgi:hypothetical protein
MNSIARRAALAAATAAAFALAGAAQAAEPRLPELTVADLKTIYLACDRAAMRGLLGAGEAARCSVVYEDLKARAFDGNFEKLLAWSREQARLAKAGT